jgi:hypothetical protein
MGIGCAHVKNHFTGKNTDVDELAQILLTILLTDLQTLRLLSLFHKKNILKKVTNKKICISIV